ncbi:30S ribosomal protein S1 [Abditibacteriota bacterium]|nr:30S ribosomal protein S1 [Abditibacteriota bacterium]
MAVDNTQTNDTTVQTTEQPTDNGAQLNAPVIENTGSPVTTEISNDQTGVEEPAPTDATPESAPVAADETSEPVQDEPASEPVAEEAPAPAEAPAAPEAAAPVEAPAPPAPQGGRQRQPSMAQVMNAETDEFAAYMSGAETLQRNAPIKGIVVRLEDNGSILVDIGSKSEGIIPRTEVGDDDVNVGDEVECVVIRREDDEGHPVLSKRRADFERQKRDIVAARDSGQIIEATVKEAVKGGLIVDLGVSAFIPASHVDQRVRGQMERLIGQVLPVKVIEVDFKKNRDKVIASHRLAAEEDRSKRENEAWANIEKDKIVEGIVRRITDFGAFIDLGGVDGLLHVREMAWGRVEHPSNVVKKGQKLQVLVLDVNEETKRIALGLKQLLPDPWKKAAKNYRVGQTVTGKVVRLAPTVAFVEIEPGIEAILPVSEIAEERIREPGDVLTVGQEVEGRLKSIQTNQRRITMSLRAAVQERERREERAAVRDVNSRADADGPLRLGDLFGKELRAMRNRRRDEIDAQASDAPEAAQPEAEEETPAVSTAPEEVPSDITDGEPDSAPTNAAGNEPVEG